MSDFTASNGLRVVLTNAGKTGYTSLEHDTESSSYLSFAEMIAWREFFRAEEDERLGRFRDPTTPGYVAYDRGEGFCCVVREVDGTSTVYTRQDVENPGGFKPAVVARAYFDAHPEPKSWHDAKHGEIWVLFVAINEEAYRVDGDSFVPVNNPPPSSYQERRPPH